MQVRSSWITSAITVHAFACFVDCMLHISRVTNDGKVYYNQHTSYKHRLDVL